MTELGTSKNVSKTLIHHIQKDETSKSFDKTVKVK